MIYEALHHKENKTMEQSPNIILQVKVPHHIIPGSHELYKMMCISPKELKNNNKKNRYITFVHFYASQIRAKYQ